MTGDPLEPHVVVIGGGFAGLMAARGLRKAKVRVTVIDRSNHHVFQPLLYQVATAGLSPADIAAPIRSILRNYRNTEVLMAEVHGIDLARRTVKISDREVGFDYLVVATGAGHSYFGHDEWREVAPGLKSIVDATAIRRKILLAFESAEMEADLEKRKSFLTFALVGGGPTGVEMAGSIAELAHQALRSDFRHIDPQQARVILIEAGKRVLSAFPDVLAMKAQKKLEELGVETLANTRVQSVDSEGVVFNGQRIHSKTVIWCAGVVASPAGRWLGAETDPAGRVIVNSDLSLPGYPNVFVIGDTARVIQNDKPLPGVAPVAMQEGKYVAKTLRSRVSGKQVPPPFYYVDKGNLATVGRSFAIADFGKIRLAGVPGWLVWIAVHIYYLIGFRSRLLVMMEWAWAYLTFQRGARLITEDHEVT